MAIRKIVAGIAALGALVLMSGCSLLGLDGTSTRDPNADITASTNVNAFDLQVGDCMISSQLEGSFTSLPVVPCTEAHDSEITAVFDMPEGIYDPQLIADLADGRCEVAAIEYVGPLYAEISSQGLATSYFGPTEGGWDNGDREVDCYVYTISEEDELTSSVQGMG